jgi:acid phosphatase (class A)
MRRDRWLPAVAALLCLGSLAVHDAFVTTPSAQAQAVAGSAGPVARPRLPGYLGAEHVPDHKIFLPAPPAVDSPAGVADVTIFRATRALEGAPRWQLATSDDGLGSRKVLGDFGCAAGVDFRTIESPALTRVLARAGADLGVMIGAAKEHYQRPRPFVTEQGPICVNVSPAFAASGSYSSGHSASAWLYALLLAEVDSEHAAAIIARGRAFGESRVVCGVHYASDVEGGRISSTALVAALHGNAEFDADMAAARAEIANARVNAPRPDAASCPAPGALAPPW